MGETLTKELTKAGNKTQYNTYARSILHNRYILAWILQGTTEEFKSCTIAEIVERYIGDTCEKEQRKNKHCQPEKIAGQNTQSVLPEVEHYTQDVKLCALTPKQKKLIVDLEAQKDFYPGYVIVTRGIFYGAMMITEQAGMEFGGSCYDELKKVYSIWVCMNVPKKIGNTITKYEMKKRDLLGKTQDNRDTYDKITVIQIGLNREVEDEPHSVIRLLNILFSQTMTAKERIERLEKEFQIPMGAKEKEEVESMCNLAEGIYEDGIRMGMETGMEKGLQTGMKKGLQTGMRKGLRTGIKNGKKTGLAIQLVSNIDNIMKNLSLTLENACQILEVTPEQYHKAKKLVK